MNEGMKKARVGIVVGSGARAGLSAAVALELARANMTGQVVVVDESTPSTGKEAAMSEYDRFMAQSAAQVGVIMSKVAVRSETEMQDLEQPLGVDVKQITNAAWRHLGKKTPEDLAKLRAAEAKRERKNAKRAAAIARKV